MDLKGKENAQFCRVRTRILGRGSGYYVLLKVNQLPTSTLVEKNLNKIRIGKKPPHKHMKFFWCDTYAHVQKKKKE